MKRALVASLAFAGITGVAGTVQAEVNCNQVNKYLQTGRTPQDVADTMVIPIDDVKKCQAQAKDAGAAPPAAGGAAGAAGQASGGGAGASAGAAAGAEKK